MSVELRERKWCRVLGIEKVCVEGCWIYFAIIHGLILILLNCITVGWLDVEGCWIYFAIIHGLILILLNRITVGWFARQTSILVDSHW